MRSFAGPRRWYTVPQKLVQRVTPYAFAELFGRGTEREGRRQPFVRTCPPGELFGSAETGLHFHAYPREQLAPSFVVSTLSLGLDGAWLAFDVSDAHLTLAPAPPHAAEVFLVFEWAAQLSPSVTLSNTLAEYNRLPAAVAAARAASWGFMLLYFSPAPREAVRLSFACKRTGMIRYQLRGAARAPAAAASDARRVDAGHEAAA